MMNDDYWETIMEMMVELGKPVWVVEEDKDPIEIDFEYDDFEY